MTHTKSREIRLKNRPEGLPRETDFELAEVELSEIGEGEVLVQNIYMSVDPYMRGRMYDRKSYVTAFSNRQTAGWRLCRPGDRVKKRSISGRRLRIGHAGLARVFCIRRTRTRQSRPWYGTDSVLSRNGRHAGADSLCRLTGHRQTQREAIPFLFRPPRALLDRWFARSQSSKAAMLSEAQVLMKKFPGF